ncbi:hypothetical protein FHE66_07915 [Georgenia sp. 311]|uniref:hypothetical protein n=1 Tax=Georgenia sp. 311 TaxID=2585134 RepID=UPI0011127434|nr:hypothetical protein [Georgenia sp. 311]TNC18349.1 hypothetical protein FHE66_07915 [Georgenia sp. 311]
MSSSSADQDQSLATPATADDAPAAALRDQRETRKARVRFTGCAAIAVLAVLTLALLGPSGGSDDVASERMGIWLEDVTNQERTQGAPQQTVVNGWTANQLLDLISQQLESGAVTDNRPAVLLTLGVLLLALSMATTPRAGRFMEAPGLHAPRTLKGGTPPWLRSQESRARTATPDSSEESSGTA